MGKLKPIGSEKLEGKEKIDRILEIARYKESPSNPINEITSNHYNIGLPDGNTYHIDKEKNGYVIKRTLSEGDIEYIEPMKNRKYYSSYSQAFKRLNLIVKEVNDLTGNDENISLFEQKKFVLKTPKSAAPSEPVTPTPELPLPAGDEIPLDDMGMEEPMDDMGGDDMEEPMDDMGGDDMEEPMGEPDEDEVISFKVIQKLTGKLGQKLRKINKGDEPISADDTKYVINSILSALDLSVLSDEDIEDIIERFENSEFESDDETDMDMEEPEMDMEEPSDEDLDLPESEMYEGESDEQWEGTMSGKYDLGFSNKPKRNKFSSDMREKMGDMMEDDDIEGLGNIFDSIFSESKVDEVIKSYFVKNDSEKKFLNEQKKQRLLEEKVNKVKIMKDVKRLSESYQQEQSSSNLIDRFKRIQFVGKTNKNNLVFETNGKQFKVTPDGIIL